MELSKTETTFIDGKLHRIGEVSRKCHDCGLSEDQIKEMCAYVSKE